MKSVDLGIKPEDSGMTMPASPNSSPGEPYYPELTIENCPVDLPDSGEITLKYRLSRTTDDKKQDNTRHTLEVLSIEDVESDADEAGETDEKAESPYDTAGDALDKARDDVTQAPAE